MADSYIEFTITQIHESDVCNFAGCVFVMQKPDTTSQTIDCSAATYSFYPTQVGTYRIYGVDGTSTGFFSYINITGIQLSHLAVVGGSLPFNMLIFQNNGLYAQDQVVLNSNGQVFSSLGLSSNQFTAFSLQNFEVSRLDLAPMPTLTSLDVDQNTSIAQLVVYGTGLQMLQPPPSARSINISKSKLTTSGIASLVSALDQNGVTRGTLMVENLPSSTYLTQQAQDNVQSLQSKGWSVSFSTLQQSDASDTSDAPGDGSTSDATSVLVLDGMMLALQTPVKGMKGLLINGNYFVPFMAQAAVSDSAEGQPQIVYSDSQIIYSVTNTPFSDSQLPTGMVSVIGANFSRLWNAATDSCTISQRLGISVTGKQATLKTSGWALKTKDVAPSMTVVSSGTTSDSVSLQLYIDYNNQFCDDVKQSNLSASTGFKSSITTTMYPPGTPAVHQQTSSLSVSADRLYMQDYAISSLGLKIEGKDASVTASSLVNGIFQGVAIQAAPVRAYNSRSVGAMLFQSGQAIACLKSTVSFSGVMYYASTYYDQDADLTQNWYRQTGISYSATERRLLDLNVAVSDPGTLQVINYIREQYLGLQPLSATDSSADNEAAASYAIQ